MSEYNNPAKPLTGGKLKKIRPDSDLSNLVYGKVLPQAVPLEEVVLGALMLDKDAMPLILDTIRPSSFYKRGNQLIYEAMLSLFEKSQPIDILTVHEALKKAGNLDVGRWGKLSGGPDQ